MNKFQITRRQAIILFLICTVSSKMQLLPCLLAGAAGKDLWCVLLFGAAIDLVFFALVITINKLCPNLTIHDMLRQTFGKVISGIIVFLFFSYFICTAVLPFEAVRDVFASNLFETIPWRIFAVFLLLCVGYLAYSGMRTIGRSAELYFPIIVCCILALIILGLTSTDFSRIFPLATINLTGTANNYFMHSIWFADYMILFVLTGRIKPGETGLKYKDLLFFAGAIVIYAAAYISLWGLYSVTASTQASLLSSISAFSLLNLDIGRVDWFLVLLSQIASVISCSTYIYCAADCVYQITNKKNYGVCVIFTLIILYLADIILFGNIDKGIVFYTRYTGIISFILQTSVPIICLISALIIRYKSKKTRSSL